MGSVNLSKSRSVLDLDPLREGRAPTFRHLDGVVSIDPDLWEDMGCPEQITVMIEPGDKLNDVSVAPTDDFAGVTYTAADGETIQELGTQMVKRPNPVWMLQSADPFRVETNEGLLGGEAGASVAYDPISGHVWPVAASYIEQHYERINNETIDVTLMEDAEPVKLDVSEIAVDSVKATLAAEATALGITVDARWGVKRLTEAIAAVRDAAPSEGDVNG